MDRRIFTLTFWADALERALSTGANNAVTAITMGSFSLLSDVPWYAVVSAFAIGAVIDLLRSLAAARRGNPGTAGFTPAIESSGRQSASFARVAGLMKRGGA